MPDYAKGKIYRVVNTDDRTVYIGSTCQTLSQRFTRHNHKGNGNRIILIEDYPCENKEHLLKREQEVMEQHRGLLNQYRAYLTPEQRREYEREQKKEYREANRDKMLERDKKYYEANRDKIRENQREYREANRDKIIEQEKKYYEANRDKILEYHKEYREANRDKILEYHKEYNDTNRKQIQARKAEKIVCEHCGSEVSRRHLVRHKRSAKCKAHQPISPGALGNISVCDPNDKARPASPVGKSST
mgnify:CR=1 FL=1